MNLADVMDEVARLLDTITGLRVAAYPPATVTPPAGVVSYPDDIQYNLVSGPTGARIENLPIVLLVGRVTERSARDQVAAWTATDGPESVKVALENADYEAFDVLTVTRCGFDTVTIGTVDYLAATFDIDIAGH